MVDDSRQRDSRRSPQRRDSRDEVRVLLVDDDERWGRVTAKHLARHDDRLDVAFRSSVTDALSVVETESVDCIVSDYRMPEQSGIDFLERVRRDNPALPFLLLTGRGDESVASHAIEEGVTGYLAKDASTDLTPILASRIRSAVQTFRTEQRLETAQARLEALHDVTLDLERVETRAEVYDRTVTAGVDVLGLGSCHVFVEDDGRLQLVESTTETDSDESPDGSASGGPEGIPAADQGEARAALREDLLRPCFESESTSINGEWSHAGAAYSVLCASLGESGVFLATASRPQAFDEHDANASDILASHAGAALDRIESRERIQLERDSKEAMRTLLTTATDRSTVEQAMCERLVDEEGYRLAWVGEYVPDSGVTVRASAGDTEYATGLSAPGETGGSAPEPSVRAVTSKTPATAEFDHESPTEWEQSGIAHGFAHAVAHPLLDDEVLHGVLAVYADDRIEPRHRRLLGEYADSLASAVSEAKLKQSLGADVVTELEVRIEDEQSLFLALSQALSERGADPAMTVHTVLPGDGDVRYYVRFDGVDFEAVRQAVDAVTIAASPVLERLDEETGLAEIRASAPTVESILISHGGVHVSTAVDGRRATVRAEYPHRTDVQAVATAVRDYISRATVTKIQEVARSDADERSRLSVTGDLTDKQCDALQTAYFNGYFERPRRHGAEEVADSLGISRQAFLQHLRVAQRKAFAALFESE